jgi:hypothetical protein
VTPTISGKRFPRVVLLESDAQTRCCTFITSYDRKYFAVLEWQCKKAYNENVHFAGSYL